MPKEKSKWVNQKKIVITPLVPGTCLTYNNAMPNEKRYTYLNAVNDVLTYDSLDAARSDAQIEAEYNDIEIVIRCEGQHVETIIPDYWKNTELDPRWME